MLIPPNNPLKGNGQVQLITVGNFIQLQSVNLKSSVNLLFSFSSLELSVADPPDLLSELLVFSELSEPEPDSDSESDPEPL